MKVPDEVRQAWLTDLGNYDVLGTPAERVERGIAWLEEVVGEGWADKVELMRFDFQNPCRCVLGFTIDQDLFEEKAEARARWAENGYGLGLDLAHKLADLDDNWDRYLWANYHGFDGLPGEELEHIWRQRIQAEQAGG